MIYGLTLIILGIIAAPSILLSRKPEAKALLNKITPYQGWIGVIFCFLGIWSILSCILNLGLLASFPIYWAIRLLVAVVETSLGFILGYGLIAQHLLAKNADASIKGKHILGKLLPFQGKLGILAIILGVVQIISTFIWRVG